MIHLLCALPGHKRIVPTPLGLFVISCALPSQNVIRDGQMDLRVCGLRTKQWKRVEEKTDMLDE